MFTSSGSALLLRRFAASTTGSLGRGTRSGAPRRGARLAVVLEVGLDLRPDLALDLRPGAELGRLAVEDPGESQSETSTDRQSTASPSPYSRANPSLPSQNWAWVRAVSAHGASTNVRWPRIRPTVPPQVELDPVHPVHVELVHGLEARVEPQHLAASRGGGRAPPASRNEPVGLDPAQPPATVARHGAPIRPFLTSTPDRLADPEAHPQAAQVGDPRRDPGLVGGAFRTRSRAPSLPRP